MNVWPLKWKTPSSIHLFSSIFCSISKSLSFLPFLSCPVSLIFTYNLVTAHLHSHPFIFFNYTKILKSHLALQKMLFWEIWAFSVKLKIWTFSNWSNSSILLNSKSNFKALIFFHCVCIIGQCLIYCSKANIIPDFHIFTLYSAFSESSFFLLFLLRCFLCSFIKWY